MRSKFLSFSPQKSCKLSRDWLCKNVYAQYTNIPIYYLLKNRIGLLAITTNLLKNKRITKKDLHEIISLNPGSIEFDKPLKNLVSVFVKITGLSEKIILDQLISYIYNIWEKDLENWYLPIAKIEYSSIVNSWIDLHDTHYLLDVVHSFWWQWYASKLRNYRKGKYWPLPIMHESNILNIAFWIKNWYQINGFVWESTRSIEEFKQVLPTHSKIISSMFAVNQDTAIDLLSTLGKFLPEIVELKYVW